MYIYILKYTHYKDSTYIVLSYIYIHVSYEFNIYKYII